MKKSNEYLALVEQQTKEVMDRSDASQGLPHIRLMALAEGKVPMQGIKTSDPDKAGVGPGALPEFSHIVRPEDDDLYYADGSRLLVGAYAPADAGVQEVSFDFPYVGTVEAMRMAVMVMNCFGQHSDTGIASTVAAQVATSTYSAAAALSIGYLLEWGATLQTMQPFPLRTNTTSWQLANAALVGIGGIAGAGANQSVNRDLTLWICEGKNGGRIFVPWAQRVSPSMQVAMPALAIGQTTTAPTIVSQGYPTGMSIGATTRLITAHSLALAYYCRASGLFSGEQRAQKHC